MASNTVAGTRATSPTASAISSTWKRFGQSHHPQGPNQGIKDGKQQNTPSSPDGKTKKKKKGFKYG